MHQYCCCFEHLTSVIRAFLLNTPLPNNELLFRASILQRSHWFWFLYPHCQHCIEHGPANLTLSFCFPKSASLDGVLTELRTVCGEDNVSLGEAIREQHGRDESVHRSVSLGLWHTYVNVYNIYYLYFVYHDPIRSQACCQLPSMCVIRNDQCRKNLSDLSKMLLWAYLFVFGFGKKRSKYKLWV